MSDAPKVIITLEEYNTLLKNSVRVDEITKEIWQREVVICSFMLPPNQDAERFRNANGVGFGVKQEAKYNVTLSPGDFIIEDVKYK